MRPPAHGEFIAERVIDSTKWQIWDRTNGLDGWINLKVMAVGRAKRPKHSYWLAWNAGEQRFAQHNDYRHLKSRNEPLYKWIKRVMEEL